MDVVTIVAINNLNMLTMMSAMLQTHNTVAMALREDLYSIDDPELLVEEKLAVVLGTEGDGLASQTIADCDYTVKIPML